MLSVGFVTTHFPPATGFGGVCESGFQLATALSRAGIKVSVITSDATRGGRVPSKSFCSVENDRLRVYPFRYLVDERLCFAVGTGDIFREVIRQNDLVHVNGIYTYPVTAAAILARRARKPYLIAVRGGLEPWRFRRKYWKKYPFYKLFVKPAMKASNCIHVTAQQELESCRALGVEGPFTIIPNGIDPDQFARLPHPVKAEELWPVLENKTVVLFLSRLSREKGLDMLIGAWKGVSQEYPEAFLVIAGPDDRGYEAAVRRAIAEAGLEDRTLLTGDVVGEKKLALYSRSDVFVLPSYSENFGNVVAEALACGIPVVTTQGTPWQEIETRGGGRWVPVDSRAIEEAIKSILSLPGEDRKRMGARGRTFILENYTWEIIARKMITVYQAILDGKEIPLNPDPAPVPPAQSPTLSVQQ